MQYIYLNSSNDMIMQHTYLGSMED